MPTPHHQIEDGNIAASIWKNGGGERGTYYTFSLSKSYERDNKTQYTTSFGYFDGIRLARITLEAVEWIAEQQKQEKNAEKREKKPTTMKGKTDQPAQRRRRGKRERNVA